MRYKDETKITIRMQPEQVAVWKKAAKDSGMSMSQYIRTCVYRQMGKGKI